MSFTKEQIEYVARLAKIKVNDSELAHYEEQLSKILTLVDQMEAADTDQIEPLSHPQDRTLRLRDDVVTESNRRDDFMALTPHHQNGLYLVPKVIE